MRMAFALVAVCLVVVSSLSLQSRGCENKFCQYNNQCTAHILEPLVAKGCSHMVVHLVVVDAYSHGAYALAVFALSAYEHVARSPAVDTRKRNDPVVQMDTCNQEA